MNMVINVLSWCVDLPIDSLADAPQVYRDQGLKLGEARRDNALLLIVSRCCEPAYTLTDY